MDKVLDYSVEKVYIYSDKIIVNFYYSEDNREVDLQVFNEHLSNLERITKVMDNTECLSKHQEKLNAMWNSIIANDQGETSF